MEACCCIVLVLSWSCVKNNSFLFIQSRWVLELVRSLSEKNTHFYRVTKMNLKFKLWIAFKMSNFSLVIIVLGLVLVKSNNLQVNNESSLTFAESLDTVYPESWIPDLLYQALVNFSVRNVGSTICQIQGKMYENHLRNHTNWAVKSKN